MDSNQDYDERQVDETELSVKRIQWHPAFCSAMHLEFRDNKDDLVFENEHNLSTKPLGIDLLIIKKEPNVKIQNEIGRYFKTHNIIEYKSPDDGLNIDVFYKGLSYACLYKALGKGVDSVKANEITLTFMRRSQPLKLFEDLELQGFACEEESHGIFVVKSALPFDIRIIVTGSVDPEIHIWIAALTNNLPEEQAKKLIEAMKSLKDKDDCEHADSVVQVAISGNKDVFEKVKEEQNMCEALKELMRPEIDAEVNNAVTIAAEEARKEGHKEMIYKLVSTGELSPEAGARSLGISIEDLRNQMLICGFSVP